MSHPRPLTRRPPGLLPERLRFWRHRYDNLDPNHLPPRPRAILRWGVWDRLNGKRRKGPPGPHAPMVRPDLERIHDPAGPPRLTWLGHAGVLGTLAGRSFLIDPVFSGHAGLLYRNYLPHPPLAPGELPPLTALLVSHSHYDHLDAAAERAVPKEVPAVAPLGLGRWFRRRGRRAVELGWWQSAEIGGLRITLVPARHWSRRRILDTNHTLWGGFVVEAGGVAVYHAGDSALFDGFADIGRRFPGLRVALLPIGGYEPGWFMENNHLNPEQAGRIFLTLGARELVPIHWGSFQLTDEPLCEPPERLRAWWEQASPGPDHELTILAVGETRILGTPGTAAAREGRTP